MIYLVQDLHSSGNLSLASLLACLMLSARLILTQF